MNKQVVYPLGNQNTLQRCSIQEIADTPVVIVAPHPDDETLGCGGAIALFRELGCDVQILVISDGTLSHPNSRKFTAKLLRELRENETLEAVSLLGVKNEAVTFLRLPDGAVSENIQDAVAKCQNYLAKIAPKIILLPWRYDPHADHRGSWQLIQIALQELKLSPRQLEYPIWDWDPLQTKALPKSLKITTWQLDISSSKDLKQQAIAQYRSQTTNLIDDDLAGFRLTSEMLASYFDKLYTEDPDPWKFETSEYEAKKYAATIAALQQDKYEYALEIGGSIGVLTEKLAVKCNSLLSIDVSQIAQSKAIQRCQNLSHVKFDIMCIPKNFPDEMFDLILVSEVGYYWGWEDMYKSQQLILQHLKPGGHLLLVHWILYARDYPLTGDEVHESFLKLTPDKLQHLEAQKNSDYRLDLFARV
jgi:LmbE family N-acetylglucosaminyl deacetylase